MLLTLLRNDLAQMKATCLLIENMKGRCWEGDPAQQEIEDRIAETEAQIEALSRQGNAPMSLDGVAP